MSRSAGSADDSSDQSSSSSSPSPYFYPKPLVPFLQNEVDAPSDRFSDVDSPSQPPSTEQQPIYEISASDSEPEPPVSIDIRLCSSLMCFLG